MNPGIVLLNPFLDDSLGEISPGRECEVADDTRGRVRADLQLLDDPVVGGVPHHPTAEGRSKDVMAAPEDHMAFAPRRRRGRLPESNASSCVSHLILVFMERPRLKKDPLRDF